MCESISITALPEYGATTFENSMTTVTNNFNIRICSNNSTSSRWGITHKHHADALMIFTTLKYCREYLNEEKES